MVKETPIINILTFKLPFELANQIYNEFQNRFKDAKYLIENYKTYKVLENDLKAIELILSLSIFNKRVIANLDAAVKFYSSVSTHSTAESIKIGAYELNGLEKNKLLAVVISYNKLLSKFSISPGILEYYETNELLKNLINLKKHLNSIDDNEKAKKNRKGKGKEDNQNDIPF